MPELAEFIDVEQWLIDNLAVDAPVGTRPPDDDDVEDQSGDARPARFVRVIRTSGAGRTNRISEVVTVILESFGPTETAALALAQASRNALGEMHGLVVGGVHVKTVTEVSGLGNLPHPDLGDRYTQTFDIHLRGNLA